MLGREQNYFFRNRREFHFQSGRNCPGFFLGFFGGRDGAAERTEVFAVKRLGHRFGQRLLAGKIGREHRRPRDGLQCDPMQARQKNERKDHQIFSAMGKHGGRIKLESFAASKN